MLRVSVFPCLPLSFTFPFVLSYSQCFICILVCMCTLQVFIIIYMYNILYHNDVLFNALNIEYLLICQMCKRICCWIYPEINKGIILNISLYNIIIYKFNKISFNKQDMNVLLISGSLLIMSSETEINWFIIIFCWTSN